MYTDNPTLPAQRAAADLDYGLLVKSSAGTYDKAGATDPALGVTGRSVSTGESVQPRRPSAGGMLCRASAAIALDAVVVQADGGKVKTLPTSGGGTAVRVGLAFSAAGADGDLISVEPYRFGEVVTIPA